MPSEPAAPAVACADAVAAALDPATVVDLAARRHLDSCPRCRRELAELRRLRRLLADDAEPPPPPPGLLDDVLSALARDAGSLRRRMVRVAPYVGGVLAATAAGAALAAVSRRGAHSPAA